MQGGKDVTVLGCECSDKCKKDDSNVSICPNLSVSVSVFLFLYLSLSAAAGTTADADGTLVCGSVVWWTVVCFAHVSSDEWTVVVWLRVDAGKWQAVLHR